MKALLLLLVIVAFAASTPLFLLDTLTNSYDTGTTWTKEFQRDDWNTELDFALYGWIKIDPNLPRAAWATIFQLTQNPPSTYAGWTSIGDQNLSCYVVSNILQCPTYSKSLGDPNYRQNWNFIGDDVGQWAFVYQGVGSGPQKQSVFAQFKYTIIQYTMPNVVHSPSAYYKVFLGQSWTWKYLPGTLAKVFIDYGASAYRESGFSALQSIRPDAPSVPAAVPQCSTIYDQCFYQGKIVATICDKVPSFDLKRVKSIWVPKGRSFTLFGGAAYSGSSTKFTESQPCIDIIELWSSFVQKPQIQKSFKHEPTTPSIRKNHIKKHTK